jgi:hypothetical protein
MLSGKHEGAMDDQLDRDASVTRKTVGHLHTLAIEQGKRIVEIERHVRDIKFIVFALIVGAIVGGAYSAFLPAVK